MSTGRSTPSVYPGRSVLAALGLAATLSLSACEEPAPTSGFVIASAAVLDGQGGDYRLANVYVDGDTIVAIRDDEPAPGVEVVDGFGYVLAPGFIDTHSHADRDIGRLPDAMAAVSQGITTVVVGQDGASAFPLAGFFADVEASPPTVNVASYVGHGTIRREVMGGDFRRAATDDEVAEMTELVTEAMRSGALGLSTGLEYDPGIYADLVELIALARETKAWGGRYASHLRSEDRGFWDAVRELIEIGRRADIPVHISHIKLAMVQNWGEVDSLVARLEDARAAGVQVSADIYPYPYWQSTMTVMFPERDFTDRRAAEFAVNQLTTPEGLRIARYKPEPSYEGKTLADVAELTNRSPADTLMLLIRDAEAMKAEGVGDVESVIATSMNEDDIAKLMAWRHTNIATDGSLDGAHPRGYGTYPRVLSRYVRERGVLQLSEAIRRMTSLAAEHMGIVDRGRIDPGFKADLVLFDSETIMDRATPADPQELSSGVAKVWVNGEVVYQNGIVTTARPGRVLRRGDGEVNRMAGGSR